MSEEISYKLVIVDDEGKTTPVPLTRDEYTIGRQEGNVIRLTERNISRRHAKLYRAKGHWIIEDLKAYNGIIINSEKVKERAVVKSGDTIQIGDYRLIFREVADQEAVGSVIVDAEEIPSLPPPPRLQSAVPGEQPKLILINGPEPGTVVSLKDGFTTMGRAETCEVQIEDVSVSREHAQIELTQAFCRIKDSGSSNGIRINGVPKSDHYLQHGDTIELGNILLRFVAAGAWDPLLEQLQMQAAMPPASSRRALVIGLPLAILGLLIVVGLAVFLINHNRNLRKEQASEVSPDELKTLSIDELAHRAQTSYEQEEWRKAVTYAAEVLKYEPSNKRMKDLKEKATFEMDQAPQFEEGLKAYKLGEWEKAYRTFSKIQATSAYRSKTEVVDAAVKFIDQLMTEMYAAQTAKDVAKVEEMALTIDSLEEASEYQKQEAKRVLKEVKKETAVKKSGGPSGQEAPDKGSPPPLPVPIKKTGMTGVPEVAQGSVDDALAEAKKAIIANDQKKCISVLQKAKTTPNVLDLLATCYKGAKEMDRYYATLKRYISKYPTGPNAEKYKNILKDAGQL